MLGLEWITPNMDLVSYTLHAGTADTTMAFKYYFIV